MKSTFKVLFFLKKNAQKKNGKMPIIARITIDGEVSQFNTKVDVHPDSWDQKAGKAVGRSREVKLVNELLDSVKATLHKHYHTILERDAYITAELLKNTFLGKIEKERTIIEFFNRHNELYLLRVGSNTTHITYSRYELTKNRLIDFMKAIYHVSDIPIKEMKVSFIENFYLYIRKTTECSHNTTIKFIQRLRTVVNYAKNEGLVFADPFSNYKIRMEKTDRGYLTMEEIQTIYKKKFASKRLGQVRDIFIFSCYTGLSYIDICELRKENICTGFDGNLWIMTKRQKTNVATNIRLLDVPIEILEKYKDTLPFDMLLPVISNQKMNEYLKEIGIVCGIDKKLTFHIARHSCATSVLLANDVPIETVSKILGHTNIRTTQIYARVTDTKMSKDMELLAQKMNNKQNINL